MIVVCRLGREHGRRVAEDAAVVAEEAIDDVGDASKPWRAVKAGAVAWRSLKRGISGGLVHWHDSSSRRDDLGISPAKTASRHEIILERFTALCRNRAGRPLSPTRASCPPAPTDRYRPAWVCQRAQPFGIMFVRSALNCAADRIGYASSESGPVHCPAEHVGGQARHAAFAGQRLGCGV